MAAFALADRRGAARAGDAFFLDVPTVERARDNPGRCLIRGPVDSGPSSRGTVRNPDLPTRAR